jgi:hypothetical protein
VPHVQDEFDATGRATSPAQEHRADRFLAELEWYAGALKDARARGIPY